MGGAFDSVEARAEVDAVEVVREDFVFGEVALETLGEGDFLEFAGEGAGFEAPGVAGELHRDGGGPLFEVAGFDVADGGAENAAVVDAVVFVEARVFAGEDGGDEVRGDFVGGDDNAVFAVTGDMA